MTRMRPSVIEEVRKELDECERLGMRIPKRARTALTSEEAEEYRCGGMRISEIADLAVQVAAMRTPEDQL